MTLGWKQKLEQESKVAWQKLGASQLRSGPMDMEHAHYWCEHIGAKEDRGASSIQQHQGHYHVVASTKAAIDCMSAPHAGKSR